MMMMTQHIFFFLKTWWSMSMLMITTFASGRWLRQKCRDDSALFLMLMSIPRWLSTFSMTPLFDTQVISVSEYVGFWNPDSDKKLTLFWSTEITRSQCTVQLEDQVSGSLTVEFRRSDKSLLLFPLRAIYKICFLPTSFACRGLINLCF